MSPPISVAVIGCGYAAELHLPAIQSLKEARLVAVCDSDPVRLHELATRHGVKRRHRDWRELVDDPTIEVIAVLTPPKLHLDMTLRAVRAGKYIMLEKPLVANIQEANRLMEEASAGTAKIMIAYNLRFHQQIIQLRDLIRSGALGEIQFMRSVATSPSYLRNNFPEYRRKRQLGGGVVIDLAVHYYDLWEFLLGTRLQEISVMSRSGEGDDVTAHIGARTSSGVLVSGDFSARATEQHEIEVYAEICRSRASLYRYDGLQVFGLGTYEGSLAHRFSHLFNVFSRLPDGLRAASGKGVFLDSFRCQWRHFLSCIRGNNPAVPGLIEGRRSLAVALAGIQSAESGRVVRIDDDCT